MKKIFLPIAITLIGLVSGCRDEKLKECMGKVEKLEDAFESTCEWKSKCDDGSPDLETLDNDLYEIVAQRNKIWATSSCGAYQARWICDYVGRDSWGGGNYSIDFYYEKIE